MKKREVRWGICGTGKTSGIFVQNAESQGSSITACIDGAGGYGGTDAVFVCGSSFDRYGVIKQMLGQRKAVLYESGAAFDRDKARELYQLAKDMRVLLMEAVWTRFLPATNKVLELVRSGAVGRVSHYSCVCTGAQDELSREGAALNLGVHAVSCGQAVCGSPRKFHISSVFLDGTDTSGSYHIDYRSGASGNIVVSNIAVSREEFLIFGEGGIIEVQNFRSPDRVVLTSGDGAHTEFDFSQSPVDYCPCISHFEGLLNRGAYSSGIWTPKDSVEVAAVITKARAE